MRLVVKKDSRTVNEFQFASGPVNIGRHADSQVFLSDRAVSRHHAVIYSTQEGLWYVQDLNSANKTYLNGEPIEKTPIKTSDKLTIADFTIEINLEDGTIVDKPINLDDTLSKTIFPMMQEAHADEVPPEKQIITRRLDLSNAPDIKIPYRRAKDFMRATEMVCRTNGLDDILKALINIGLRQLGGFHVWASLRHEVDSVMTTHAGKNRDGSLVKLDDIKLKDKIDQAVEKGQFYLFPQIPFSKDKIRINSAMIVPIIGLGGCFGVLYIDNASDHEHYSLADLDYLMLIAVHTSVIIENF